MSSSTGLKMKIYWIALPESHGRPACEKPTQSRSFVTGDESTGQRNGADAKASPHNQGVVDTNSEAKLRSEHLDLRLLRQRGSWSYWSADEVPAIIGLIWLANDDPALDIRNVEHLNKGRAGGNKAQSLGPFNDGHGVFIVEYFFKPQPLMRPIFKPVQVNMIKT
jgi:hypothetical protein